MTKTIDIVFDGPPSHESGRFVEVEDDSGKSIGVGEWVERDDGLWALRLPDHRALLAEVSKWKERCESLANFNPDWDILEATQESLREHMKEMKRSTLATIDAIEALTAEVSELKTLVGKIRATKPDDYSEDFFELLAIRDMISKFDQKNAVSGRQERPGLGTYDDGMVALGYRSGSVSDDGNQDQYERCRHGRVMGMCDECRNDASDDPQQRCCDTFPVHGFHREGCPATLEKGQDHG